MTSGFSNSAVEKVAKELEAVSVLSSRNLQKTLSSLPSSVAILLVEDLMDEEDNVNNDDVGQKKDQESEDDVVKGKDNEERGGKEEDNKAEYEEADEEKEEDGEEDDEEGDEDEEKEDDEEEDGPLFALYCGGETSVIAGLGQENGYYQVGAGRCQSSLSFQALLTSPRETFGIAGRE